MMHAPRARLEAAQGYLIPSLNAYDANPVWNEPKQIVFRDVAKRSLTDAGLGSVGEKAAAAIADYVVLDMFASFCTGREDAKDERLPRRTPYAIEAPDPLRL
jgi:multiple sugar transport system substrate-binding protein